MEKEGFFLETKEMIEEYVEDRILLLKLQLTEKAAKLSSVLFIAVAVGFLLLILFMIVSFVAGYYLSQAVGSYWGGFGILAVFYLVVIFILLYMHKAFLNKYIIDKVVKNSFNVKKTSENGV
jgi:energy-coupling factor transporter transmembrane protein EcfT